MPAQVRICCSIDGTKTPLHPGRACEHAGLQCWVASLVGGTLLRSGALQQAQAAAPWNVGQWL